MIARFLPQPRRRRGEGEPRRPRNSIWQSRLRQGEKGARLHSVSSTKAVTSASKASGVSHRGEWPAQSKLCKIAEKSYYHILMEQKSRSPMPQGSNRPMVSPHSGQNAVEARRASPVGRRARGPARPPRGMGRGGGAARCRDRSANRRRGRRGRELSAARSVGGGAGKRAASGDCDKSWRLSR